MTSSLKKKFVMGIGIGLIVIFVSLWVGVIEIYQVPPRVFMSTFWTPDEEAAYEDTIVMVDMGSDESWPLEWKGPGSFLDEEAYVKIVIINYRDVTMSRINSISPKAVILTGYKQPLSTYNLDEMEGLFDFLRETELPVLGICGGHQFIGKAYGSDIVPLGFEEKGFIDVSVVVDDPIFEGLSSPFTVFLWHELQVEEIPHDFILLGGGTSCPIQVMRHREKPIYGVQFHPEYSSHRYQDGVIIFRNFLTISDVELKER